MIQPSEEGQIITFYSYKGGTGRTMALANVACLLAESLAQKEKILMIDWDLEAPGLHLFFRDRVKDQFSGSVDWEKAYDDYPGLIDLFLNIDDATKHLNSNENDDNDIISVLNNIDLDKYIIKTDIKSLNFIKAGGFVEDYADKISTFKWRELFRRLPNLFRVLAELLASKHKYILIDSRTGINDTSGICTMLMPNKLVVVFTPNRQSLRGLRKLIQKATDYRKQSEDFRPLVVYPLASRVELSERKLYENWRYGNDDHDLQGYQLLFEELFSNVYSLPNCSLNDYFDEVQIQHVPAYAFGEKIAILIERGRDRLSSTRSYMSFTNWLVNFSGPWDNLAKIQASSGVPVTHVVDAKTCDGFHTITEAIKAANPGDKVLIHPGLYQETLVIDKPLDIIGEGNLEYIIIESKGNSALQSTTPKGHISNLSLRQLANGDCYCVDIAGGHLELEGCDITSKSLGCVVIRNGAEPRLSNNRIHDSKQTGILIYNSHGILEGNNIFNHGSTGVEILDNSNPTLRNNRINGNNQNGVIIYNDGKGVLEDNEIFCNNLVGIEIKKGGNPILRRNKIHDGMRGGILIRDNGSGVFEENDIFSNAFAGVEISDNSNPIFRRNLVYDNKQGGILIKNDSGGIIEDNSIYNNEGDNVEIGKGCHPMLRRNSIYDGKKNGLYIHGDSKSIIEDNDIFKNAQAGVKIGGFSNPILRRNEIHEDKGVGIYILNNGCGIIEDNNVTDNKQAGISIEGGNPLLRRNCINRNGFHAICVYFNGAGTIEYNDLRDNIQGAWDITPDNRLSVKIFGNVE